MIPELGTGVNRLKDIGVVVNWDVASALTEGDAVPTAKLGEIICP